MAQLYQWSVPCTICESPVEYHCNTCGDVLCSKCRDNHLKSNATKHHDVVPYLQRIEPNRPSQQCGDHPGHQCGVWCKTCDKAVCQECLISPNHRGHLFLKFAVKVGEKKKEIQGQFEKYSKLLSDWQTAMQEVDNEREIYEEGINHIDKEIVDRADELCKQVRSVESASRKQLQEMKGVSLKIYGDQQKTLGNGIQKLKEKIKGLEDTLRSNDTTTILQYHIEYKMAALKPSGEDSPIVPTFTPGTSNIEVLKKMFGYITDGTVPPSKAVKGEGINIGNLLTNPSVESVISVEKKHTPALVCLESGHAWVRTASNKIQLVNRQGNVERSVNINFFLASMTLAPKGDILLPDFNNKCIKYMCMEGNIKNLFSTEWKPHGICCLPNGDIVVAFSDEKRVVQYSSTGKLIKALDRSLFHYPWHVAYGHINNHLYVIDKSNPVQSNAPGRVRAFEMNGMPKYTYDGPDASTFAPVAVCVDQEGRVFITDLSNDRVHILDKGGNFLQYITGGKQGLTRPDTIDVDREGYVWIGEWNTGKLKVVKYIE